MSALSKYEQETIINYNNEEKEANIFTHSTTLMKKLDKKMADYPDIKLIQKGEDYGEYSLPKKWIKVSFPRQLSDEQREVLVNRMNAARESANANKG